MSEKSQNIAYWNVIIKVITVIAVLFSLGVNFQCTGGWVAYQLKLILPHWKSSLAEKHKRLQGDDYYNSIQAIGKTTPRTARILFPPRSQKYAPFNWSWRNNFYLCPRELIYSKNGPTSDFSRLDYVLVYKNFPDFPVAGEKIILNEKVGLYRLSKRLVKIPAENK